MTGSIAPRWKDRAAGLLAILAWGTALVWIIVALRELEPVSLLSLRVVIGALVTWILAHRTSAAGPPQTYRTLLLLAGLGAIGVSGNQWLHATGMQSAGASEAAWLSTLAPAFLAYLASPLPGERQGAAQAPGAECDCGGSSLAQEPTSPHGDGGEGDG